MRALILVLVIACKGDETQATQPPAPQVQPVEALPPAFPLPESARRTLVRSSANITMTSWEYEYPDLGVATAIERVTAGLPAAGFAVTSTSTRGDTHHVLANASGRTYAVALRASGNGTSLTIRSFPAAGPPTLAAPESYPAAFPFLAGGTASHAADGAELRVAFQQAPGDVEVAIVLAATRAGWSCTGTGSVRCTKDQATVAFRTESAPGGALLVVTAR